jgi:signal transduction histidine kinase
MKLRQVIINLLNNAIKFTDQGSVDISVRTVTDEPFVEFVIADTGIGIAEEFLPHIFDKFSQVDSSTTRYYSGAGLGLYLVKSFVGHLGGSVMVQSKLNKGTTFTVRLPVRTAAGYVEDGHMPPTSPTNGIASSRYAEGEL